MNTSYIRLASVYGEGAYNTNNYNGTARQGISDNPGTNTGGSTTTPAATGSVVASGNQANNQGGILANTGMMIGLSMGLACAIVAMAIVIKVVRRKPAPVRVEVDNRHDS